MGVWITDNTARRRSSARIARPPGHHALGRQHLDPAAQGVLAGRHQPGARARRSLGVQPTLPHTQRPPALSTPNPPSSHAWFTPPTPLLKPPKVDGKAIQSPFRDGYIRVAFPADTAPENMTFVLKQTSPEAWHSCGGGDFRVKLKEPSGGGSGALAGPGGAVLAKICEAEGWERFSLFQRFCLALELTPPPERADQAARGNFHGSTSPFDCLVNAAQRLPAPALTGSSRPPLTLSRARRRRRSSSRGSATPPTSSSPGTKGARGPSPPRAWPHRPRRVAVVARRPPPNARVQSCK